MEEDLTIVCPRDNVVVFKTSGHCTNGGCMTLHVCVYVCICMCEHVVWCVYAECVWCVYAECVWYVYAECV